MGLKDSRATRRVELQVTGPAQLPAMRWVELLVVA
jgi:hypothetical protein